MFSNAAAVSRKAWRVGCVSAAMLSFGACRIGTGRGLSVVVEKVLDDLDVGRLVVHDLLEQRRGQPGHLLGGSRPPALGVDTRPRAGRARAEAPSARARKDRRERAGPGSPAGAWFAVGWLVIGVPLVGRPAGRHRPEPGGGGALPRHPAGLASGRQRRAAGSRRTPGAHGVAATSWIGPAAPGDAVWEKTAYQDRSQYRIQHRQLAHVSLRHIAGGLTRLSSRRIDSSNQVTPAGGTAFHSRGSPCP